MYAQPQDPPPPQETFPEMPLYPFPAYPPAMYSPWAQHQQQMMQMFQNPYAYCPPSTSEVPNPDEKKGLKKTYPPLIEKKAVRSMKFDEVSGRLCLLTGCKKYVVTAGEICRRMSLPETLHTSLINGILRNAKAKDNGSKLRSKLQYFNIQLPQGRRKTCRPTGFTALCEAESVEIAVDLRKLLESEGGASDIAEYLLESQSVACDLSSELAIFRRWMAKIIEIYPVSEDPDDISPKNLAEEAINHMSLLTHGFSHIAIPVVLRFALAIADKMENPDENKPANPPSIAQSLPPGTPCGQMNMFGTIPNAAASSSQMPFDMSTAFPNPYSCYMNSAAPWAQPMMPAMIYNDYSQFSAGATKAEFTSSQPAPSRQDSKTYEPLLKDEIERKAKFDECSARLQLLSASRKYVVTTGEVCRRMSAPETLHSSLINGILRNAKAKDNGTKLRTHLQHFNVELPQGRRKTCNPTKFTAMCEEESWSLAKDFQELVMDDVHGGAREIGTHLAETADEHLLNGVEIAKKWLLKMIIEHPIQAKPEDIVPMNKAQRAVHHLSLITHGFSHVAVPVILKFAVKILEVAAQAEKIPGQAPPQQPPMMMMPPMMPFYQPL